MVFTSEAFDPLAVLQTVQAERCTTLYGVPTMFIAELDHPRFAEHDLSSLRTGIMAGAPCPIEVMRRVVTRMHMHEVTIAYGMTETSPISFQSSLDDTMERRVTTVGRVQPHLEVKIVDAGGRIVPRGQTGELLTRGYSVMLGYWGDDVHTRESICAAGWMHTGDLATIDAQGYCSIVGTGQRHGHPRRREDLPVKSRSFSTRTRRSGTFSVGVPDPKRRRALRLRHPARRRAGPSRIFATSAAGKIARYKIPRIFAS